LPLEVVTQNVCSPYEKLLSGVKTDYTCIVLLTCACLFLWVNISEKCFHQQPDRCCPRCYGTLDDDDDDDDDNGDDNNNNNNNNKIFVY
jgi:hypothetical protein